MSDGWSDYRTWFITNFLVNNPSETAFLKTINTSLVYKRLAYLKGWRGECYTCHHWNNAFAYVSISEMFEEKSKKIIWAPYVAYCIDKLKDIGEFFLHRNTIENVKTITIFMYYHRWVFSLVISFIKRKGIEEATCNKPPHLGKYFGINSQFESYVWLQKTEDQTLKEKTYAVDVEYLVLIDENFGKHVQYCMKCTMSILKVFQPVDGGVKPAMDYAYEAIYRERSTLKLGTMSNPCVKSLESNWCVVKVAAAQSSLRSWLFSQFQLRINHYLNKHYRKSGHSWRIFPSGLPNNSSKLSYVRRQCQKISRK